LSDPQSRAYVDLLRALHALEPPLFVFGGFAEDALLHGTVSRPHSDVDVLVFRGELELRLAQFRALGFASFATYYEIAPGKPLVLNGEQAGLHLELGIFELTGDGRPFFEVYDAHGTLRRVTLSAGALPAAPVLLDGVSVRALSPLALYQLRAGLHAIRAFGPLRPTDVRAQAQLKHRFFGGQDEASLLPTIERASSAHA
jgi:hypothetical protein